MFIFIVGYVMRIEMRETHFHHRGGAMIKKVIAVSLMIVSFSIVYACENPDYVFSVIFKYDLDYKVDLSLFEVIGDEGINYLRGSTNDTNITMTNSRDAYSYRSHYNDYVLIEVASAGINFIIDSSGLDIDVFKADSCIIKELEWLNLVGIVQINKVERNAIAAAFSDSFKSDIYWTKWDVLANSEMTPDSSGNFKWVRCNSEFLLKFPSKPLEYIVGTKKDSRVVHSERPNSGNSKSVLIDIRGRKIQSNDYSKFNSISNVIIRYDLRTGVAKRQVKM